MKTRIKSIPPWDPYQRAEDWRRANAADDAPAVQANAAAARAANIERIAEAYWQKHGRPEEGQPAKPAKPKPGPKTQEAMLFAEALQRAKRGQVAEAVAPNGNHKLPRFTYCGRYGAE